MSEGLYVKLTSCIFILRYIQCIRGLAMRILSVCMSARLLNA